MAHGSDPDIDRLLGDPAFVRTAAQSVQALSAPSRLRILARLHADLLEQVVAHVEHVQLGLAGRAGAQRTAAA
jgi:hypothetical protein